MSGVVEGLVPRGSDLRVRLSPMRPFELMTDDTQELEPGRAAFNRGDYFLAHELWEEVWRKVSDAEQRTCLQGLIQIAAGLHHLQQHRRGPGTSLLGKGLQKLSRCRKRTASFSDLQVDRLAGQVARLLVELAAPKTEVTTEATAGPDLRHLKL